jgi:hypothetical protein
LPSKNLIINELQALFTDDADVENVSCPLLREEAGPFHPGLSLVLEKYLLAPGLMPSLVHFKGKVEGGKHLSVFCGPRLHIFHMMKHEGLCFVHLPPSEFFVREGVLRGSGDIDWAEEDCIFHFGKGKGVLGGILIEAEGIFAPFFAEIPKGNVLQVLKFL